MMGARNKAKYLLLLLMVCEWRRGDQKTKWNYVQHKVKMKKKTHKQETFCDKNEANWHQAKSKESKAAAILFCQKFFWNDKKTNNNNKNENYDEKPHKTILTRPQKDCCEKRGKGAQESHLKFSYAPLGRGRQSYQ